MPGQNRIYTAGEKEYDTWLARKDKGVPFNDQLLEEFRGHYAPLTTLRSIRTILKADLYCAKNTLNSPSDFLSIQCLYRRLSDLSSSGAGTKGAIISRISFSFSFFSAARTS